MSRRQSGTAWQRDDAALHSGELACQLKVGGLVWALALQLLFVPLLARRLARRPTCPGVPTLPRIPGPRRNVPAPSAPLAAGGGR